MKNKYVINTSRWALILACLFLTACSMRLVSEYDERSVVQMEDLVKKIELMYLTMESQLVEERQYVKYEHHYLDVLSELSALELRQQYREHNDQTQRQVKIAIDFWKQDMKSHKHKNTVSNFLIKRHRNQYMRLFTAMILGESYKQNNSQKG